MLAGRGQSNGRPDVTRKLKTKETVLALHSDSYNLLSSHRFLILLISVGVCHVIVSFFASLIKKRTIPDEHITD